MKRYIRLYFYAAAIINILVMSLILINLYMGNDGIAVPSNTTPIRLICVYSGTSDYYKTLLEKGLQNAAKENNIWLQFVNLKSYETEKHCTELDKAIASKVDGIITNVPDDSMIEPLIDKAYSKNIPVILIENDLPNSKRISFIGTNGYAFGSSAAKLLLKASEKAEAAIFKNTAIDKYDLKNLGFRDALPGDIKTEMFIADKYSVMEYTTLAQTIFNTSGINSFFCPDSESTIGVARAVIEFNKTNSTVIGSGDSEEILQYIKNGLIYASQVEDWFSIGYLSVTTMLESIQGENISETVNPEIIVITKYTIDKFMDERRDNGK